MKELERVELIKDRAEYAQRGIKVGHKGTVMLGDERNGYVLVFFDGEYYKNKYGVMVMREIDVGVRVEDLKIISDNQ
ncbi:MAG: hypothetical protein J5765_03545 [Clostridia bacterium]|nr:hypothetical protein [Clostridia bacterium]